MVINFILISMSEEEFQDGQQKKGKSAVEGKREYGCPCGKTYLSYPALFTHVKQKHEGKPPGPLTKPKTDKARGRPKIHIDIPEDDMSDGAFNLQQEIDAVLSNALPIVYDDTIKMTSGNRSCQDMASVFVNKLSHISSESKPTIYCFLNELKYAVDNKYGEKYWVEEKPSEIIDIANDLCHDHESVMDKFPLEKSTLIELMYILFRWMYKSKWTDHKLIKRATNAANKTVTD